MTGKRATVWTTQAVLATALAAQSGALLPVREANQTFTRSVQLMESTSVAIPELMRAGAPVIENARHAARTLEQAPGAHHAGVTYAFLMNAKAYVALADSVPKPFPFPDEARKQFAELRESVQRVEAHFRALLDQKEQQIRNPDRDNLRRYSEANQRVVAKQPGGRRVVFLGDSITDGWRLNEYFPEHDFINRGISGQITGEMLGRMKADVIDLKPDAVLVLAGTNDLARGVAVTVIQNNLAMIADLAQANQIKPILASVLPVSDYHKDRNPQWEQTKRRPPELIRTINSWLQAFCANRGYVYVDYYSQTVDPTGTLKADLADDGLHPNSSGYRIMAPLALEAIEKTFPKTPQQKGRKRRLPQ